MGRVCLIEVFASHYRTGIFTLMDKELQCDFVFGDNNLDIKKIDYNLFQNNVTEVHNVRFGPFLWQRSVIKYLFKDYEDYIISGNPTNLSNWVFLILAKLTKKRVYIWTHGWYGRESLPKKIIKKAFFGLANGLFVYGDHAKRLMIDEGFNPKKLFAIHNSLDYNKQLVIRNKIERSALYSDHFCNHNRNLIFIGRLTKIKQLDLILDVIKKYKEDNINYNITFIGKGEDFERLKEIAKNYNIEDRVWFYGACYDEVKLSQLIYNADLCISPGNVGLTAIHSLMYGCPVVTHNNFVNQMPEFEAVVEGCTGSFFEYNNKESLYTKINNWFSSNIDRETIRARAFKEVDDKWNPYYQLKIINEALEIK